MISVPYPIGFHLEVTNMCTLKCSGCARTQFIEQWPNHWENHNLDYNDLSNFLDIDIEGMTFFLCGNYGDPIYHPDLYNIINILKSRGGIIEITTNGSYRKQHWWKKILSLLDSNDSITFSIDGIPENFTEYRKNADWKSIEVAIKECVKSDVKTIWKYIVFSFNENNMQDAEDLSRKYGIDKFKLTHSERFDKHTNHLLPKNKNNIGKLYTKQINFKSNIENNVDPQCKKTKHEHYISANGYYSPCCKIADHRFYYKTQFGKNRKEYSIRNTKFSELMQSPKTIEFYSNIESSKPSPCQYNCPKQ